MRFSVTLYAEMPGDDPDITVEVPLSVEMVKKMAYIGEKNLAEHRELRLLGAAVLERSNL